MIRVGNQRENSPVTRQISDFPLSDAQQAPNTLAATPRARRELMDAIRKAAAAKRLSGQTAASGEDFLYNGMMASPIDRTGASYQPCRLFPKGCMAVLERLTRSWCSLGRPSS